MRHILKDQPEAATLTVDSAGTAGYHIGALPDPRSRQALTDRGYAGWSQARQVTAEDFRQFDYIFAMDEQNVRDLGKICPDPALFTKVKRLSSFAHKHSVAKVADPYYGGPEDFAAMVLLLEDACLGVWLDLIQPELSRKLAGTT